MILHIFTQNSEYSKEFLRLIKEEFKAEDHIIVFRKKPDTETKCVSGNLLCYFLESRKELMSQMPLLLEKSHKIIFHSFPVSRSLFFWFRYRKYMRKSVWSVWGQDAYWFKYCRKTLSNLLYELIRGLLIRRLEAIFCPILGDYEYIKEHYRTKASYISGMYPIPTDFDSLKKLRKPVLKKDIIKVQLGNSANPTNNLEELILYFSSLQDKDRYLFYCPLSYGDKRYANKILDLGNKELGEHFIPLLTLLNRDDYSHFIASVDVLIMNHQRQQGLGNIFSYLYLGKKVYIRSDNSSYPFFEQNGIKVYNTNELLASGKDTVLTMIPEEVAQYNMDQTEVIVSRYRIAEGWRRLFN